MFSVNMSRKLEPGDIIFYVLKENGNASSAIYFVGTDKQSAGNLKKLGGRLIITKLWLQP